MAMRCPSISGAWAGPSPGNVPAVAKLTYPSRGRAP
jgi:hypothetical protein